MGLSGGETSADISRLLAGMEATLHAHLYNYRRSKVRSFKHPVKAGVVLEGSKVSGTPPTNSTGVGLATPTGAEVGRLMKKPGSSEDSCSWPSTKRENWLGL